MAKVIVALAYMVAILVIGILASRKVKTADDFAVAGRQIPFWTNVYSMASAQIGAGATMGVASMCYAYGISGQTLGIGAALGAILSGLVFAKKIREANVTTIPELIRNSLGKRAADLISILSIFSVFSILAGQVRSLGTILQIFIPSLDLFTAILIMSVIMLGYSVAGGLVSATKTDKLNIIIMVLSVMVIIPIISFTRIGGLGGIAAKVDPKYVNPTNMGVSQMISMMLYFGLIGMVNNENFIRICGAKNANEARGATITASLLIYLPYMIFAGLIGYAGIALIPNLESSDSIFPAMIDQMAGGVAGAFLLSGLLAAVMGTAASVAMTTGIMVARDVVNRIKPLDGNKMLLTQRIAMIVATVAAIFVGYFGRSIVGIMEDVGAPAAAAIIPIFCGIFFWKKMNEKGALVTIAVAVISTLGYWALGSPLGISHFIFGLICSTITMIIACNLTYEEKAKEGVGM